VHVAETKVPVELEVNVTVPVGTTAPVPDESATVALQLVATLVLTVAGLHTTLVVVDLIVNASVKLPALPV
jgi:hypothetical protein